MNVLRNHSPLNKIEAMSKPIRIMVVDDQDVIGQALEAMLETHPHISVVARKTNGAAALQYLREGHASANGKSVQVDVVLMDLKMADTGADPEGLMIAMEIIRFLNHRNPEPIKVIMFSVYNEGFYIKKAFDAGIHGYLSKACKTEELITAIETVVYDKKRHYRGEVNDAMEAYIQSINHATHIDPSSIDLTATEQEILALVADGWSEKEIAKERRNKNTDGVATHKRNVRVKLGANNSAHMVAIAFRLGLLK